MEFSGALDSGRTFVPAEVLPSSTKGYSGRLLPVYTVHPQQGPDENPHGGIFFDMISAFDCNVVMRLARIDCSANPDGVAFFTCSKDDVAVELIRFHIGEVRDGAMYGHEARGDNAIEDVDMETSSAVE